MLRERTLLSLQPGCQPYDATCPNVRLQERSTTTANVSLWPKAIILREHYFGRTDAQTFAHFWPKTVDTLRMSEVRALHGRQAQRRMSQGHCGR
jgi:hypothetical protein